MIDMNELNDAFNAYIEEVKKLGTNEKRKELYDSIFELARAIQSLAQAEGIQLHYLQNREIEDLYQENVSEDDYLEAMLVYIEIIKNIFGEYLLLKQ